MHRYYCIACKLIYKYLKHGPRRGQESFRLSSLTISPTVSLNLKRKKKKESSFWNKTLILRLCQLLVEKNAQEILTDICQKTVIRLAY